MDGTTGDLAKMATRRVRRPKDKEKLVQRLVDEDKVFETFRDTLAFAAALGYAKNTRTAFEQSSEPIPWSVFSGAGHEALVNMISVMSTKDFAILSPGRFEERLLIFEEFANGGLHILNELVARAERQSLDLVLDLIMDSEGPRESGEEPEIKKFASDLSW
jgi:dnd system-associated protein 4